ncbi:MULTISPECIES: SusD/RagB family nutrient-binding outer membrane lipoprotein [Flavobacteriaceae]|uniref:SusD/RagB family nutrient-binding outer membrane lipoprotein n=1 Tax=Flavobacteriaceae TaxID=49546 RepID=UPI001490E17B|nr:MULTISPECIES: SusD/RagB family nutrient-binding outer membrane lipoprotein [Allomuricauda]MDC6366070.1 SusD/RagB family nutrient-binding outer membrane lipoprotein [Muricauda sp. AC10]
MKSKIYISIFCVFLMISCSESFEELNSNPNAITVDERLNPSLLIKGTMLADIAINVSHLQRISGMWSGQYRGEISLYLGLYNYDISSEESNSAWGYVYNGILKQNREIAKYYNLNGIDRKGLLISGITRVIEAHAVGTATMIWGDIPYSEVGVESIEDPKFDTQTEIYEALQNILDEAIILLGSPDTDDDLDEDIFFEGDKEKWLRTAYTLKARYYLQNKQYTEAYEAAQNGISEHDGSMRFTPLETGIVGTENLLYRFMIGSRIGFMSVEDTFFRDLLSIDEGSRRNDKTDEKARRNYLEAGGKSGTGSTNIINGEFTPMNLVTYQENLLILAETGARTISFEEGLNQLNLVREFLESEDSFDIRFSGDVDDKIYEAYADEDFEAGGMENEDGIDKTRALLREIIEERYVTGFGTFMPWNDLRRLRTETDIVVPVPFNRSGIEIHPQRFIISQNELNSNNNAPVGLSIFEPMSINQ